MGSWIVTHGFVEVSYIINTSCILSMSFTAVISGPTVVGRGGNPNSVRKLLQKCWQLFVNTLYSPIPSHTLSAVLHSSVRVVRRVATLVAFIPLNRSIIFSI